MFQSISTKYTPPGMRYSSAANFKRGKPHCVKLCTIKPLISNESRADHRSLSSLDLLVVAITTHSRTETHRMYCGVHEYPRHGLRMFPFAATQNEREASIAVLESYGIHRLPFC